MMNHSAESIALLTSLPRHQGLLESARTPISRLRLERRLQVLPTAIQGLIGEMEAVLHWGALAAETDNQRLVSRQRHLLEQLALPDDGYPGSRSLRALVAGVLDYRTLFAALAARENGLLQAPRGDWTCSRYQQQIERNWQEPYFHLERAFPWLPEVLQLMHQQQPWLVEKRLLQLCWQFTGRFHREGDFSLCAVMLYVLRWDMIDRWTRYNSSDARQRFQELCWQGRQTATTLRGDAA